MVQLDDARLALAADRIRTIEDETFDVLADPVRARVFRVIAAAELVDVETIALRADIRPADVSPLVGALAARGLVVGQHQRTPMPSWSFRLARRRLRTLAQLSPDAARALRRPDDRKIALALLLAWPRALTSGEVVAKVTADTPSERQRVGERLLVLCSLGVAQPVLASEAPDRYRVTDDFCRFAETITASA